MWFRILAATAFLCLAANAASQYTFDFHDRSVLVRAHFPEASGQSVTFVLQSWAGISDFDRDIVRVSAVDGTGQPLAVAQPARAQWMVRNNGRPFDLSYLVVPSKDAMVSSSSGSQFHVTLVKDWVLLWGHAFVLLPDNSALAEAPASVQVVTNEYGPSASTVPAGGSLKHLSDLSDQLFLAGSYRVYRHSDPNVQYYFANRAGSAVTDADLMNGIDKIVRAQIRYMGVVPADPILVAVTDGTPTSSGGTQVRNSLVIYPDFSQDLRGGNQAVLRLAAHELFHLWNGGMMEHAYDAEWSDGRYGWFKEGMTEYYSAATLFREHMLDATGFAAFLNSLITDYTQNPESLRATPQDMGSRHWLDHDHSRLPYTKGALIGLLMDLQLRSKTGPRRTLDDYMRAVLRTPGGVYTEAILREDWVAQAGSEGTGFWDRYVATAAPLPIAEICQTSGLRHEDADTPLFEIGFTTDPIGIGKNSRVTAVIPGSNAEKAGIRAGDILAGISYWSGDPSKRASFTLTREGQRVEAGYLPVRTARVVQIAADGLDRLR